MNSPLTYDFFGIHVLAEVFGVNSEILNDIIFLEEKLYNAIDLSKAHSEGKISKSFLPQGVSIIYLLSESHTSIHTYPEHNALFFDAFTCGYTCNPSKILDSFCSFFDYSSIKKQIIYRKKEI